MLVGSDVASKDCQAGIAIALAQITEDLVVRTVFFDDVNNVLDGRSSAHLPWNHRWRTGCFGLSQERIIVRRVEDDPLGISGKLALETGQRQQLNTSLLQRLDRDRSFRTGRERTIRPMNIRMARLALAVGYIKVVS